MGNYAETDMVKLAEVFLEKEKAYIYKGRVQRRHLIHLNTKVTGISWESFDDYCEDVFKWLRRVQPNINSTIVKFCGRSIRRSKLFVIKLIASPIIARLAFFDKHKIFNITRDDLKYINRRVLEAIFDFSISDTIHLNGYPMNPFGVLRDNRNFQNNPLIGIVSILFIHENVSDLLLREVHFAQSIDMTRVVQHLISMKYEKSAIIECISSFVLSGLFRPIIGSSPILEDESGDKVIVEGYIIDNIALNEYVDIILFKKLFLSLTFYNMALRSRYKIRGDRHIDNIIYEIYTFLVFVFDLLEREQALEQRISGTGASFRPLSARIRHVFKMLTAEFHKIEHKELLTTRPKRSEMSRMFSEETDSDAARQDRAELFIRTRKMFEELRWRLSKQAGIIQ